MSDFHAPGHDRDRLAEQGGKGGGVRQMTRDCPLCGASDVHLSSHLGDCEGEL
jgi:hypothetical protein